MDGITGLFIGALWAIMRSLIKKNWKMEREIRRLSLEQELCRDREYRLEELLKQLFTRLYGK
jgi:hypothetical protein